MHAVPLGRTGLKVTPVCVGTSPLGNFPEQYGYEVSEDVAVKTIQAAFDGPFTFIDTSNNYGDGRSEERIGRAIAAAGGLPADVVVATKVDPAPGSDDFSGQRVRRSVAESLERLGLDRLPLVYLHDPERMSYEQATGSGGAVEALVQLQHEGVIDHLGVAGGPIELMRRYLSLDVFDAVISHNRWTLLDRSAGPLIDDAAERGVAFVNAAPYGGGMLSRGPDEVPTYCYGPTTDAVRSAAAKMLELCRAADIPLGAAALQFSTRDPRVASTIVGMSSPRRIEQTLRLYETEIPQELWARLDALTPEAGNWLR